MIFLISGSYLQNNDNYRNCKYLKYFNSKNRKKSLSTKNEIKSNIDKHIIKFENINSEEKIKLIEKEKYKETECNNEYYTDNIDNFHNIFDSKKFKIEVKKNYFKNTQDSYLYKYKNEFCDKSLNDLNNDHLKNNVLSENINHNSNIYNDSFFKIDNYSKSNLHSESNEINYVLTETKDFLQSRRIISKNKKNKKEQNKGDDFIQKVHDSLNFTNTIRKSHFLSNKNNIFFKNKKLNKNNLKDNIESPFYILNKNNDVQMYFKNNKREKYKSLKILVNNQEKDSNRNNKDKPFKNINNNNCKLENNNNCKLENNNNIIKNKINRLPKINNSCDNFNSNNLNNHIANDYFFSNNSEALISKNINNNTFNSFNFNSSLSQDKNIENIKFFDGRVEYKSPEFGYIKAISKIKEEEQEENKINILNFDHSSSAFKNVCGKSLKNDLENININITSNLENKEISKEKINASVNFNNISFQSRSPIFMPIYSRNKTISYYDDKIDFYFSENNQNKRKNMAICLDNKSTLLNNKILKIDNSSIESSLKKHKELKFLINSNDNNMNNLKVKDVNCLFRSKTPKNLNTFPFKRHNIFNFENIEINKKNFDCENLLQYNRNDLYLKISGGEKRKIRKENNSNFHDSDNVISTEEKKILIIDECLNKQTDETVNNLNQENIKQIKEKSFFINDEENSINILKNSISNQLHEKKIINNIINFTNEDFNLVEIHSENLKKKKINQNIKDHFINQNNLKYLSNYINHKDCKKNCNYGDLHSYEKSNNISKIIHKFEKINKANEETKNKIQNENRLEMSNSHSNNNVNKPYFSRTFSNKKNNISKGKKKFILTDNSKYNKFYKSKKLSLEIKSQITDPFKKIEKKKINCESTRHFHNFNEYNIEDLYSNNKIELSKNIIKKKLNFDSKALRYKKTNECIKNENEEKNNYLKEDNTKIKLSEKYYNTKNKKSCSNEQFSLNKNNKNSNNNSKSDISNNKNEKIKLKIKNKFDVKKEKLENNYSDESDLINKNVVEYKKKLENNDSEENNLNNYGVDKNKEIIIKNKKLNKTLSVINEFKNYGKHLKNRDSRKSEKFLRKNISVDFDNLNTSIDKIFNREINHSHRKINKTFLFNKPEENENRDLNKEMSKNIKNLSKKITKKNSKSKDKIEKNKNLVDKTFKSIRENLENDISISKKFRLTKSLISNKIKNWIKDISDTEKCQKLLDINIKDNKKYSEKEKVKENVIRKKLKTFKSYSNFRTNFISNNIIDKNKIGDEKIIQFKKRSLSYDKKIIDKNIDEEEILKNKLIDDLFESYKENNTHLMLKNRSLTNIGPRIKENKKNHYDENNMDLNKEEVSCIIKFKENIINLKNKKKSKKKKLSRLSDADNYLFNKTNNDKIFKNNFEDKEDLKKKKDDIKVKKKLKDNEKLSSTKIRKLILPKNLKHKNESIREKKLSNELLNKVIEDAELNNKKNKNLEIQEKIKISQLNFDNLLNNIKINDIGLFIAKEENQESHQKEDKEEKRIDIEIHEISEYEKSFELNDNHKDNFEKITDEIKDDFSSNRNRSSKKNADNRKISFGKENLLNKNNLFKTENFDFTTPKFSFSINNRVLSNKNLNDDEISDKCHSIKNINYLGEKLNEFYEKNQKDSIIKKVNKKQFFANKLEQILHLAFNTQ